MSQPILLDEINEREREIIGLLADELTNSQIADRLFLAESTVKWYIRQINSKLDTKNREEILERAQELGLLTDDVTEPPRQNQNLPRQTTVFIGRESELDDLYHLLKKPEVRLLTILAPGGMGKTRLALEAAQQQLDAFTDGVYFVPLETVADVEQILPTIAYSIDYRLQSDGRSAAQQIMSHLKYKKLLLVLDNWEHLLDGINTVNDILREAPDVKVLATSREKLNLIGETIYDLKGMRFAAWQTVADALEHDAVQLLVQAAQRAKSDWRIDDTQLDAIARICDLTEGMPLGILLAVSWLNTLPLNKIADQIQKSIDILETDMRDVPARQRSIRAVFNWSWQRLSDDEQTVLTHLAVFRGGFTLEAAETIAEANLRQLRTFVDKSLLIRLKDERYDMPHLLRQYAEPMLKRATNAQVIYDGHASYYLQLLTEQESALKTQAQTAALRLLDGEFDNLYAAWEWAVQQRQFDSLNAALEPLRLYCVMRGRLDTRNKLFAIAWKLFGSDPKALDIHPFVPRLLVRHSREEAAICLEKAQESKDIGEAAFCFYMLGYVALGKRHYADAIQFFEESRTLYQQCGEPFYEARVLGHLAVCYLPTGQIETAARLQQESLQMLRDIGDQIGVAGIIYARGTTAFIWGTSSGEGYQDAERLYREAYTIHQEMGNPAQIGLVSSGLSLLLFLNGDLDMAHALAEQCVEIVSNTIETTDINYRGSESLALCVLGVLAAFKGEYEESRKLFDFASTFRRLTSPLQIETNITFGLAILELEQNSDKAAQHIAWLLRFSQQQQNQWAMTLCLPLVTLWLAKQNSVDARQLVALLGLLDAHPASAIGWLQHWKLFQTLRQSLQEILGDAAYQSAWDEGKSLELETVVSDLLAEFGEDEA